MCMWTNYRKLTKQTKRRIGVVELNGERFVKDSDKAEALNKYFSEVGADQKDDVFDEQYADGIHRYVSDFDFAEESDDQSNDFFDEEEVSNGLRELNAHKATGADEVHNRFLMQGGTK